MPEDVPTAMRFGVVGYGAFGRLHAQSISRVESAALVAICARSDEAAASAAADFPGVTIHRDYRALVQDAVGRRGRRGDPQPHPCRDRRRGAGRRQGPAAREADGEHGRGLRPADRGGKAQRPADQRRPRASPVDPVGHDQAADRRGRDRGARATPTSACSAIPTARARAAGAMPPTGSARGSSRSRSTFTTC